MAHEHHHHGHAGMPDTLHRAFLLGIGLNLLFVAIEAGAGFYTGSLALLTDAGHNLGDVGSLGLSLLALRLARLHPGGRFSYGYRKGTILASLVNACLLVALLGGIVYEAFQRLSEPPEVPGLSVAAVAAAGIAVNALSAWLFYHNRNADLNAKGAFLHLAADAAVSAGVVVAGITIYFSGWRWLDPAVSFVISAVILWGACGLFRESVYLTLDAAPANIPVEKVRSAALGIKGVKDIHHIHVWAISTTENAMTAHLVLEQGLPEQSIQSLKKDFRHALEHLQISHATLETESERDDCGCRDCH
jgi:cobalt-zinc-cadmium efflux system protein